MKKILVLCTGNSCRSQMAHGFLKNFDDNLIIFSAGTNPEPVNKYAVKVMSELDINISNYSSNHIDEYLTQEIDLILTVCDNAKEICPIFPNRTDFIHFSFDDPANAKGSDDEKLIVYRRVRDEINAFLKSNFLELIKEKI